MSPQKETLPCTLTPINLHNPPEYAALQSQRKTCGWDYDDTALTNWRDKQDAGLKSFFWITVPRPSTNTDDEQQNQDASDVSTYVYAGHISLDAYADPPDEDLARADRTVLTIASFFVQPDYRASGVGRAAMDQVEALATQAPYGSPDCQFLAVTTRCKRYYVDEEGGVNGTGLWKALGGKMPSFWPYQWYERRGYVWWKSEERWHAKTVDGKEFRIVADFMRKPIVRA